MKRVVVSGYYGFGNTGDEAVLAGMLATFRRLGIDAVVTVLSAEPDRTIREHPGVRSVRRPGNQRRRQPVSGRYRASVRALLLVRVEAGQAIAAKDDGLCAGRRAAYS